MEFVSIPAAREAERLAKAQRIAAGRWLRVDETKITSPKDMMLLHRVRAAAAEGSEAFDTMLMTARCILSCQARRDKHLEYCGMQLAIAMKLSRQNVEIPAATRATPAVEFIVLLGHSGHDRDFLSVLHPAIGTCIRHWKALIYARVLGADARSYRLRLRFQFFRLFYLAVEKNPVLQHSLRDFAVGIRHAQVS